MSNNVGAMARQRHFTTLHNVDREILRRTWSIETQAEFGTASVLLGFTAEIHRRFDARPPGLWHRQAIA